MMVSRQVIVVKHSDLEDRVVSAQAQVEHGDETNSLNGEIVLIVSRSFDNGGENAQRRAL